MHREGERPRAGGDGVVWSRGEERPYHRHFGLIFAHCLPGPIIVIKACLVGNLAVITGRTSPGLCLEGSTLSAHLIRLPFLSNRDPHFRSRRTCAASSRRVAVVPSTSSCRATPRLFIRTCTPTRFELFPPLPPFPERRGGETHCMQSLLDIARCIGTLFL